MCDGVEFRVLAKVQLRQSSCEEKDTEDPGHSLRGSWYGTSWTDIYAQSSGQLCNEIEKRVTHSNLEVRSISLESFRLSWMADRRLNVPERSA